MAFRFESLEVWQLAFDLADRIDQLSKAFPKKEQFNLSTQIKRAADSVALNIAEGSTGQSKPEFRRFVGIALRSAIEVVACLFLARRRNYIDETCFMEFYSAFERLCKMLTNLRKSL